MSVDLGMVAAAAGASSSDAQLVALAREGDEAAFEELYRRYAGRLRGFVARRVGDPSRAEDLTQEAFLSALRALRSSDAEIAWKPWLFEIARNATIDFHRRRRRSAVELSVEQGLPPLDRLRLVDTAAPDAELAAKERLDHLRAAFDELPAQDHRVLVMRELEGRSYREIAERMKLTLGAVESSLFRGRRRLALEYEELAAGRRCTSARATIALLAEGVESTGERRRLARHARRCRFCRRYARELGVEPFTHRRLQRRVAALLPLGWLFRRSADAPHGQPLLLGSGGQLGAGLAERATALVTAGALACAGSVSLGVSPASRTPSPATAVAHVAGPAASAGGASARPRSRHAPAPRRARDQSHSTPAGHAPRVPRAAAAPPPTAPHVQPALAPQPKAQPMEPAPQTPQVSVVKPAPPAAAPPSVDVPSHVTATVDVLSAPGNVGQALPG